MVFTFPKRQFIFLHFEKKRKKIALVRAELQLAKHCGGQNQKFQNSLSCKLNDLDCIGVKSV